MMIASYFFVIPRPQTFTLYPFAPNLPPRHSREGGNPYPLSSRLYRIGKSEWIPAFAGMTGVSSNPARPARPAGGRRAMLPRLRDAVADLRREAAQAHLARADRPDGIALRGHTLLHPLDQPSILGIDHAVDPPIGVAH